MESIKITSIKNKHKIILAVQLLRTHVRTNEHGADFLGLKEAKDMVDAMYLGQFPDKLYIFNALSNEFNSMFVYNEAPVLKLYKVTLDLSGVPRGMYEVIILAVGAATARIRAQDHVAAERGVAPYVRNVTEITEFKRNTILASYEVK